MNQYLFKADDFLRMSCTQRLGDPLQESRPSERKCRSMVDCHLKNLQQSHISQWEVRLARNYWFIAPVTGVVSRGFQGHWEVRRSGFNKALYKVIIMRKDRMGPSAENSLGGLLKNLYRIMFLDQMSIIDRACSFCLWKSLTKEYLTLNWEHKVILSKRKVLGH